MPFNVFQLLYNLSCAIIKSKYRSTLHTETPGSQHLLREFVIKSIIYIIAFQQAIRIHHTAIYTQRYAHIIKKTVLNWLTYSALLKYIQHHDRKCSLNSCCISRPFLIFMHADLSWHQLYLMISRSTIPDFIRIAAKLKEFGEIHIRKGARFLGQTTKPRLASSNVSM